MLSKIEYRVAHLNEAKKIADLINYFAEQELMLKRNVENIIENIRNFIVAIDGDEVVGCCALAFFSEKLAEIRSIAVSEKIQKAGIGGNLIKKAESVLKEERVQYVFVLTRSEEFFEKMGYEMTDKSEFPQKIWRDCMNCSKIMNCDETAMRKKL